jgi:hypothetical protein
MKNEQNFIEKFILTQNSIFEIFSFKKAKK